MANEKVYDVLVFGAGPAGAASALFATNKGLKTAVVYQESAPPAGPRVEWFPPQGAALLAAHGTDHHEAVVGTIDRVRFVDAGCTQEVRAAIGQKIEVVDSAGLAAEMLARAKANGAEVFVGQVKAIRTQEKTVGLVTEDGAAFAGKVLIAADGSRSLASRSFDLERETGSRRQTVCCQALAGKVDLKRRAAGRAAAELTLLLTSDDLTGFGYTFALSGATIVGLMASTPAGGARAAFGLAIKRWKEAGFLPAGINAAGLPTEIREAARGSALDYDTHVGKNALLIGDAGGYVAAVSHEGLYPAIWSASLAVDVCGDALSSAHLQDGLMVFDSRWRQEMADYLRPPNSDLRFLLPLIFSNKRMAEKLAQAFFLGTNL
jgi:flavin-dependent dehydrogenase